MQLNIATLELALNCTKTSLWIAIKEEEKKKQIAALR